MCTKWQPIRAIDLAKHLRGLQPGFLIQFRLPVEVPTSGRDVLADRLITESGRADLYTTPGEFAGTPDDRVVVFHVA